MNGKRTLRVPLTKEHRRKCVKAEEQLESGVGGRGQRAAAPSLTVPAQG